MYYMYVATVAGRGASALFAARNAEKLKLEIVGGSEDVVVVGKALEAVGRNQKWK